MKRLLAFTVPVLLLVAAEIRPENLGVRVGDKMYRPDSVRVQIW